MFSLLMSRRVAGAVGWSGGSRGRRSGDGKGDIPTTLPSGQSLRSSLPGTKYPVRGIPHFDIPCNMHTYSKLFFNGCTDEEKEKGREAQALLSMHICICTYNIYLLSRETVRLIF